MGTVPQGHHLWGQEPASFMVAEFASDVIWLSLSSPALHYLMGVGVQGNPKGLSQSKVGQFDGPNPSRSRFCGFRSR